MELALHNLTTRPKKRPKKRVGRGLGSGRGTYSGRGIKGQRSRAGGRGGLKKRSLMKQFLKKTPKIGGFRSLHKKRTTITLRQLEQHFAHDETVSHQILLKKKLLTSPHGSAKIVSSGKLTKKLTIAAIPISQKAKEKIIAAGGSIIQ